MSRYEDSCPFESRSRANQCESCATRASLPPCVAAYLRGPESLVASNVVSLRQVIAPSARKAA
jgi:hypothetical protein